MLGSRVLSFSFDTIIDQYKCILLKKDEYGVLRTFYEDTTRTQCHYEGLYDELMDYMQYPPSFDSKDEVVVYVQVTVHEDGTMSDVKLFFDPGDPVLDEDAVNAVKSLKNKWEPERLHGEPIEMRVLIPVYYRKRDMSFPLSFDKLK